MSFHSQIEHNQPNFNNLVCQELNKENLSFKMILEISKVFNVQFSLRNTQLYDFLVNQKQFYKIPPITQNQQQKSKYQLFQQIKNKITYFFINQGQGYKDYLNLPKFKHLKPDTYLKFNQILDNIWNKYIQFKQNVQKQQSFKKKQQTILSQLQQLVPKFNTIQLVQKYHLNLLEKLRQMKMHEKIDNFNNTIKNDKYLSYNQYENFYKKRNQIIPNNLFIYDNQINSFNHSNPNPQLLKSSAYKRFLQYKNSNYYDKYLKQMYYLNQRYNIQFSQRQRSRQIMKHNFRSNYPSFNYNSNIFRPKVYQTNDINQNNPYFLQRKRINNYILDNQKQSIRTNLNKQQVHINKNTNIFQHKNLLPMQFTNNQNKSSNLNDIPLINENLIPQFSSINNSNIHNQNIDFLHTANHIYTDSNKIATNPSNKIDCPPQMQQKLINLQLKQNLMSKQILNYPLSLMNQQKTINQSLNPFKENQNNNYKNYDQFKFLEKKNSQRLIQNKNKNVKIFTGLSTQINQKLNQYKFIECLCQGKFKDSDIFKCINCQFHFHYKCLKLNGTLNQPVSFKIPEQCPSCKITKSKNIFTKIHKPFFKRYYQLEKNQDLVFKLNQRQYQNLKLFEESIQDKLYLQCQLRFQKMRVNNNDIHQQSKINAQSKQIIEEAYKKKKIYNSVSLPSGPLLQRDAYFKIKIQFNELQNCGSKTFFFAICMIEHLTPIKIGKNLFDNLNDQNSVGQEYIRKFIEEQKNKPLRFNQLQSSQQISQQPIQINLTFTDNEHQQQKFQMLYPVRGVKCNHYQVFDLINILNQHEQQKKNRHGEKYFYYRQILCPFCQQICNQFIADRFLYGKIKEKCQVQKSSTNQQNYIGLKIHQNGQIEWIQQKVSNYQNYQNQNDPIEWISQKVQNNINKNKNNQQIQQIQQIQEKMKKKYNVQQNNINQNNQIEQQYEKDNQQNINSKQQQC